MSAEVIDLINTIAAQTHILALNAAVESAGAADSEQGQRFAVVASEFKKLAGRSRTRSNSPRPKNSSSERGTRPLPLPNSSG